MRRDPYNSKERYLKWKACVANGIPNVSSTNTKVILQFLSDMETGRNVGKGSRRGARGYLRLQSLRHRLVFLAKGFEGRFGLVDLRLASEDQVHEWFGAMQSGGIRKTNGKPYQSSRDYMKVFKTFWHWHMRVSRKAGIHVEDICEELDDRATTPPWVYLTRDEVEKLARHAKPHYAACLLFLFDTGIRAGIELLNVRVRDLLDDCTRVRISDEASKTYGRTIRLLISPQALRDHIQDTDLAPDAYLFSPDPRIFNRYLKRLAHRTLGTATTRAGKRYNELSMHDLRHCAACYWRPRYPTEAAFNYRFGWTGSRMANYYTNFIGMHDTITHDHLTPTNKTQLETDLETTRQENAKLHEQLTHLQTNPDTHLIETLVDAKLQQILTKHNLTLSSR